MFTTRLPLTGIACLALAFLSVSLLASPSPGSTSPAQVMFFGTFHFKDAGLDMVKLEDVDVLSDENQAYLESLTDRLAAFGPTVVLLEYNPARESEMNARYADYLAGNFELGANEIYQLGFRIARKAGLERVHSFDHRDVPWPIQELLDYAKANHSPGMERFNKIIADYEAEEVRMRAQMTLGELLLRHNQPEHERANMDLYLATNAIGADDSWVGSNATTGWWERNFRMYARVQQHAQPGARVIAIGGAGHTAILKKLLEIDKRLQAEDPRSYLAEQQPEPRRLSPKKPPW